MARPATISQRQGRVQLPKSQTRATIDNLPGPRSTRCEQIEYLLGPVPTSRVLRPRGATPSLRQTNRALPHPHSAPAALGLLARTHLSAIQRIFKRSLHTEYGVDQA